MLTKKTFFLLPVFIIFSTTALLSMDGQQQGDEIPVPPAPAAQKTSQDELNEAQAQYWNAKQTREDEADKLNTRMNKFKGSVSDATARETVALTFRAIDRGLSHGAYAVRKKCNLLTEEEQLALDVARANKKILDESLKEKKANTDLNKESTNTQKAQRANLKSQTLYQKIVIAEKACNLMDDGFDNPACKKRLRKLFAKAGMPLPEETED